MRLYYIAICVLPRSTIYFHISHKLHDFRKEKLLNTKCVFCFSLQILSEKFLVLRRAERDMTVNVYRCACKVPDVLVRF